MRRRTLVLMIGVMGFCILLVSMILNTISFSKYEEESYVHAEKLNTVSAVNRINYALGFGKTLDKFYGLTDILNEVSSLSDSILGIEVIDQNGEVIETVGEMGAEVRQTAALEEYLSDKNGVYVFVDMDAGQMILRLDASELAAGVRTYITNSIKLAAIVLFVILLLSIAFANVKTDGSITVRRMRVSCLLLLIGGQVVFGGICMKYVDQAYQNSLREIAQSASMVLQSDINTVLRKGLFYDEIGDMTDYLEQYGKDLPEFRKISILKEEPEKNDSYVSSLSIRGTGNIFCVCTPDQTRIRTNRLNNMIDAIILVLVTVFISIEGISFLSKHLVERGNRKKGVLYLPGFRLFVFIYGIAFSLDCGFISVLSNKMYERMHLPSSMSFLSGMPNTMFSAAVLIGLFACSYLISRIGMRRTMLLGVSAGVAGYLLCIFAVNLPLLIFARFVYGFCDGLVVNAIRLFASVQKDEKMHSRILIEYLAAVNLGICCGVVIGGLIADVASYRIVFVLGTVLGTVSLFLINFSEVPKEIEGGAISFISAIKELRVGRVLAFMLFVVVPIYISTLFVAYTFPLFGDEKGFSNAFISGALMINYLLVSYLTDPISDWVMKRVTPKRAAMGYMVLQCISIGIFVFSANIMAALLALVLTSLWDCFGMVVIDSVLDDVKESKRENTTLLQMIFGKAALSLGPVMVTARLSDGSAAATGVIVACLAGGMILYSIYEYGIVPRKGK